MTAGSKTLAFCKANPKPAPTTKLLIISAMLSIQDVCVECVNEEILYMWLMTNRFISQENCGYLY